MSLDSSQTETLEMLTGRREADKGVIPPLVVLRDRGQPLEVGQGPQGHHVDVALVLIGCARVRATRVKSRSGGVARKQRSQQDKSGMPI